MLNPRTFHWMLYAFRSSYSYVTMLTPIYECATVSIDAVVIIITITITIALVELQSSIMTHLSIIVFASAYLS